MDVYLHQEIQKHVSRIQGLIPRIQQVSRLRPGSSELQVLAAIQALVRISEEGKPMGALSSVLRNDASIRSVSAQINSMVEQRLAFLVDLLVTSVGLRRGFDATRGHFPRIARDLERAMLKKRAETKSGDPD